MENDERRSLRGKITEYIRKKYGAEPERLWLRWPDYTVFRHADNEKWFGIIMDVSRERLGLCGKGPVDIINVKIPDPRLIELLIHKEGYLRGYHQSKGNWLSILLDGSVPEKEIAALVDMSFMATASAKEKRELRGPKDWLVPSNPAYYDIVHAYDGEDTILWKQGRGIKAGDIVFIYAGARFRDNLQDGRDRNGYPLFVPRRRARHKRRDEDKAPAQIRSRALHFQNAWRPLRHLRRERPPGRAGGA